MRFPEFTEEWKEVSIKDISTIVGGGTPDTENSLYWNGDIVWFTPSEIGKTKYVSKSNRTISEEGLKNSSAKVLPQNTILLSSRATVGECSISTVECSTNQGFQSIIHKKEVDLDFLYYLVQTQKKELLRRACGSTFLEISSKEIQRIKVKVPALDEQYKIGYLLSLIDKRIETQIKIIEDLKKIMSAIRTKIFNSLQNQNTKSYEVRQVLNYEQPTKYIVRSNKYSLNSNLIPVLTANKTLILGYTEEDFGIYRKGNCIIFDDFTMDAKFIAFPFKVKSSAIKILTAKPNVTLRFVFEYILFLGLKPGEHRRHYISEVSTTEIKLPSKEKQDSISSLLTSLERKIQLEHNLIRIYIKEKQFFLSKLFI